MNSIVANEKQLGSKFLENMQSSTSEGKIYLPFERDAIAHLCVPLFYSSNSEKRISYEDGQNVEIGVKETGFKNSENRLKYNMSEDDLARQTWFIQSSIDLYKINNNLERAPLSSVNNRTVIADNFLQFCRSMMRKLKSYTKTDNNGLYYSVIPILEENRWTLARKNFTENETIIYNNICKLADQLFCDIRHFSETIYSHLATIIDETIILFQNQEIIDRSSIHNYHKRILCNEEFIIACSSGLCASMISSFLFKYHDIGQYNEFLRSIIINTNNNSLYYGGIFQVPPLYFSFGLPCILLALIIAQFSKLKAAA